MMKRGLMSVLCLLCVISLCAGCANKAVDSSQQTEDSTQQSQVPETGDPEITEDIDILVPFAAGGAVDVKARIVAKYMEQKLGVKVNVENVTGGGGSVCATQFLTTTKNPYTMIFTTSPVFTLSPLVTTVSYTYEDVLPLAALDGEVYGLFTCPEKSGLETFDDVIAYGKDHEIIFGSGGPTTNLHIMQNALYSDLGLASSTLPHSGAKEGLTNVMGGHSTITMAGLEVARDFVAEGMVEPVLVFLDEPYTGFENYEVPPVSNYTDQDIAIQGVSFFMASSSTPADVSAELEESVRAAIADPACKEEIAALNGFDWMDMTSEEAMEYLAKEHEVFKSMLGK